MRVSVVLVSWNAADALEPCLASLPLDRHQVIVVDNASSDGSADLVAARFPVVTLLRQPRNLGFAGGVNAALPHCQGQVVLLLNCDTTSHPDAIDRLADALRAAPDCGAAGGCLLDASGRPQHGFHVRRFPTLATWLVDLWLIDKVWPTNPVTRRYHALDQTVGATAPVDVDQPAAACLMVRRDLMLELEGLDERFWPAWFEDVDLCRRIRLTGRRILYVPEARFGHAGGLAMRRLGLGPFARAWYRNLLRYVAKHHGRLALAACRGLIVTGMMPRILAVAIAGRGRDAAAYASVALDTVLGRWQRDETRGRGDGN